MKPRIRLHDGGFGFIGEIEFGHGRYQKEYTDPFGNKAFRTEFEKTTYKAHNIVTIGGYQFAFSKLFNIPMDQETTLRVGDLNDEAPMMRIGVQRDKYQSIYYDTETSISNGGLTLNSGVNISALNHIFGFMMGDGSSREDNITPISPNYTDRTLSRAIPFRMSNDGYAFPEGIYYGKSETFAGSSGMNPISSYYIKKFDNPQPRIVHAWVTDNPNELEIVDETVFASTSSLAIESYVEMNMSVDQNDGRGFFTSANASPRVNEFALVSGWYNAQENDWEDLVMMTKFVRPSITLAEGDSVEMIYRLYAR